jgi:UDP-N-acetylglucosamine/UDP-N-acetylgalactosamine diphosphorylase
MAQQVNALPVHYARKKVAFINSDGHLEEPSEPNAIKFEQFIFDLLPFASQTITVEVDPAMAFAPLKNGPGASTDTAEHVQQQMMHFYRKMLHAAGIQVDEATRVEIDPRFALTSDELKKKLAAVSFVENDTYFH